jgi:hypothetical protein
LCRARRPTRSAEWSACATRAWRATGHPTRRAHPDQRLEACRPQSNEPAGAPTLGLALGLVADTAAQKTDSSSNDSTYLTISAEITNLGSRRDTLATEIQNHLYATEFNDTALPNGNSDLVQCHSILHAIDRLAKSAVHAS